MVSRLSVTVSRGELRFGYCSRAVFPFWSFAPTIHSIDRPRVHVPQPTYICRTLGPGPLYIEYDVGIPFWLSSLVALAAFLSFRRLDRRSAIPPGCCVHCGYDASKCTDNRCSECGEPLAVEAAAAE